MGGFLVQHSSQHERVVVVVRQGRVCKHETLSLAVSNELRGTTRMLGFQERGGDRTARRPNDQTRVNSSSIRDESLDSLPDGVVSLY